jgi:predicted TIM-barrel fold metal-dependent hydrolase
MGNNESHAYVALLDKFPNLYLDTTLAVSNFFPAWLPGGYDHATLRSWLVTHPDRIIYGTDWPNVPHEWCTELWELLDLGLPESVSRQVLGGNAMRVYGIVDQCPASAGGTALRPDMTTAL